MVIGVIVFLVWFRHHKKNKEPDMEEKKQYQPYSFGLPEDPDTSQAGMLAAAAAVTASSPSSISNRSIIRNKSNNNSNRSFRSDNDSGNDDFNFVDAEQHSYNDSQRDYYSETSSPHSNQDPENETYPDFDQSGNHSNIFLTDNGEDDHEQSRTSHLGPHPDSDFDNDDQSNDSDDQSDNEMGAKPSGGFRVINPDD